MFWFLGLIHVQHYSKQFSASESRVALRSPGLTFCKRVEEGTVNFFDVSENAGGINDICLRPSFRRCLQTDVPRNERPSSVSIRALLSPSSAIVLSTAVFS